MATEQVDTVEQEIDFPTLCRAVADASPMPMAGLGGFLPTLRYVIVAFCLLSGKSKDERMGTPFCGVGPGTSECILLLGRVVKTGLADRPTGPELTQTIPSTGHTQYGRCSGWTRATSGSRKQRFNFGV